MISRVYFARSASWQQEKIEFKIAETLLFIRVADKPYVNGECACIYPLHSLRLVILMEVSTLSRADVWSFEHLLWL